MKNNYQRKVKKELIPTCNIMGVNIAAINMEWLLNYLDKNLSEKKVIISVSQTYILQ